MVSLSPGLQGSLWSQQAALQLLYNLSSPHFLLAGNSDLVLEGNKGSNSFSNLAVATTVKVLLHTQQQLFKNQTKTQQQTHS